MTEQPPESLDDVRPDLTQTDDDGIDDTPYIEPDPERNMWPEHWTQKQRENWCNHCQDVYDKLRTDLGRRWYRRCFRPKQRYDGVIERDHVETGEPEMYIYTYMDALFNGTGVPEFAVVHRTAVRRHGISVDDVEHVIADITQARVAIADEEERRALPERTLRLAGRALENSPLDVTLN
jgi:hypothetical protein